QYAREVPWLKWVATVSRPWEDEKWKGETGRVEDVLRKYADMWEISRENCVAYLCGHPEMIEHCKEILKRSGYPKEALKEEVYWVPAKKAARETQHVRSVILIASSLFHCFLRMAPSKRTASGALPRGLARVRSG